MEIYSVQLRRPGNIIKSPLNKQGRKEAIGTAIPDSRGQAEPEFPGDDDDLANSVDLLKAMMALNCQQWLKTVAYPQIGWIVQSRMKTLVAAPILTFWIMYHW
jgi:hypothetical protein